jgi:hypothetical protein
MPRFTATRETAIAGYITNDHHQVGLLFEQYRFDARQDFGGLAGTGAGADLKNDLKCSNADLTEKMSDRLRRSSSVWTRIDAISAHKLVKCIAGSQ